MVFMMRWPGRKKKQERKPRAASKTVRAMIGGFLCCPDCGTTMTATEVEGSGMVGADLPRTVSAEGKCRNPRCGKRYTFTLNCERINAPTQEKA